MSRPARYVDVDRRHQLKRVPEMECNVREVLHAAGTPLSAPAITRALRAEPLREDRLRADLALLRQRWRRWVIDHLDPLRSHEPTLPAGLPVNRASDNWRPLLSIADLAGGEWPARARAAALALSGVRVNEDEPVNVMLLADVRGVFDDRASDPPLGVSGDRRGAQDNP